MVDINKSATQLTEEKLEEAVAAEDLANTIEKIQDEAQASVWKADNEGDEQAAAEAAETAGKLEEVKNSLQ